ncbi:MAG: hypothetical protein KGZ85_12385 [Ignavibacterium sp.]|nr:hypothetical protein [Ignavibacterium sp.]
MKQSEIKQKLESKSRDELNIIAKKLGIKNRHKLRSVDLISSILEIDNKKVSKILHVTWWGKYHNHIYGLFSIIGTLLAIYFLFYNENDIIEKQSESELALKSTISLESNLIETYLFDDSYSLKIVLQNESEYNWHNVDLNIFTLYFINEEPCLSQDKAPFVHKMTKNVSFLGRGKSLEMNISFLGDYYQFSELNNIIVNNIKLKDGFINPFLFSRTFNSEETIIKYGIEPKKFENKLFRLALFDLLKQSSFLPMVFQLMRNEKSKYGGFVDFIQITGELRSAQRDYKFLKLFPVINMWYSNEEKIQYAHNFLIINSALGIQSDYFVEQDSLILQKPQTTLLNSTPKEDQIRRRLESEKKIAIEFTQVNLGWSKNFEDYHIDGIVLSSPYEKNYKSIKTVLFNTRIDHPWFVPLPDNIKLKPCN